MPIFVLVGSLLLRSTSVPAQEESIASGPLIAHEPASTAVAGEPLTVLSRVSSIGTPIRSVTLNYSLSQDISPSSVVMQPSGMGMYMGTIPAAHFSENETFWYYIEAVDESDEWAETTWYKVMVKRAPATPEPPAVAAPTAPARAPLAPVAVAPPPRPAPPAPAPQVVAPVQPAPPPRVVAVPPARAPQPTPQPAPQPSVAASTPVPRAAKPQPQRQPILSARPVDTPPPAAQTRPASTPSSSAASREVSALPPEEKEGIPTPLLVGGGVILGGGIIAAIASGGGGGGGGGDDGTPPPATNNPPAGVVCTVDELVGSWSGPSPSIAPGFSLAGNGSANFVLPAGGGVDPGSWALSDCTLTLIPAGTNDFYRGSGRISDDKTRVIINQIEYIRN